MHHGQNHFLKVAGFLEYLVGLDSEHIKYIIKNHFFQKIKCHIFFKVIFKNTYQIYKPILPTIGLSVVLVTDRKGNGMGSNNVNDVKGVKSAFAFILQHVLC